jgi:hypothetical protein
MKLVDVISERSLVLLNNLERIIHTSNLEYMFCGMPIWKHIYHTLYWFDYWFTGPDKFCGAIFHEENLHSLDIPSNKTISREQLVSYHKIISEKTKRFLDNLSDDMLYEQTEDCEGIRMETILGQFRHAYCHIGSINGTTIVEAGKWPFVAGRASDFSKGLYE